MTILLLATAVEADNTIGSRISQAYRQCINVAQSTADEGNCLDQEYARQKIKLSQAYNRLLQEQDPKQSKAIETAQKAWLQFRKVDCEAQALKGGSGAYNSHITCLIRLTTDRISEMEGYGRY
mgnify:FL=1